MFWNFLKLGAVELFLQMPDESEKSFEAALEIIKINISEKKNQIANDSDGKLVGKLLPEVEALQVFPLSFLNLFE